MWAAREVGWREQEEKARKVEKEETGGRIEDAESSALHATCQKFEDNLSIFSARDHVLNKSTQLLLSERATTIYRTRLQSRLPS
jgi:hypothetical protein